MRKKAFIFTGISFLLVVGIVILAASLQNMIKTGDIATTTAIASDQVFYTYHTIELNFRKSACNYIYLNREINTVNATAVQNEIVNTWIPIIENNFSRAVGLSIDIDESSVNVTFDSSRRNVNFARLPVVIRDQNGRILYNASMGPYSLPIYCGNPTSTQTTCQPAILVVNAITPNDGATYDTCSEVTITANATTDCGEQVNGGDASFTAYIYREDLTIDMTDDGNFSNGDLSANDGIYSGIWRPNATQITNITITGVHNYGYRGIDVISGIKITACGNKPPNSRITFPSNGTEYGTCPSSINITGTASDSDGSVQYVEVSYDGGSTWHYATFNAGTGMWYYTWNPSGDGTYNIKSRATDNLNDTESIFEEGRNSIYVTISGCNQPPEVNILSPGDGDSFTSCEQINIIGNASDSDGFVSYVEVSYDGGSTWHNASFLALFWYYNFTPTIDGNYTIKARAYDNKGAMSSEDMITISVSGCGANCTNLWSASPDVVETWEAKDGGEYELKKTSSDHTCNDQDPKDLTCEEKGDNDPTKIKHKILNLTWYNATTPDVPYSKLCSVNLTIRYNLEENNQVGSSVGRDVKINLTNMQNSNSRLYDINDTAEDRHDPSSWHNLTMQWPPAPTFSLSKDLTFRLQIDPQAEGSWRKNDKIKLNIGECIEDIKLYVSYSD